ITFDENAASQTFGQFKTTKPVRLREFDSVVRLGSNPLGPIDDSVAVLRIDALDGRPLAVVVNYACHGTSLGGRNNVICGEWRGRMMPVLQKLRGGQRLFLEGAAGDINPRLVGGLDGYRDRLEKTDALGEEIAREVIRVYGGIVANDT